MNSVKKNKILNFFKLVLLIIGILIFFFGFWGGITELSAEQPKTIGYIIAPILMGIGILFVFISKRKKKTQPSGSYNTDISTDLTSATAQESTPKDTKTSSFFKISLFIIGILVLLFGFLGGIIELSADKPEKIGLIITLIFMGIGVLLIFISNMEKKAPLSVAYRADRSSAKGKYSAAEETESSIDISPLTVNSDKVPWERTFLIVSAYIEIVFILLGSSVALFFGYAGFEGGEMGLIIGVMMFMALLMFSAFIAIRVVALRGIHNNKRWAVLLNYGLMAVLTILMLVLLNPLCIYTAFVAWCSYKLSKHPSFK